jgi:tRNA1Val (adenine37-N6)-methyltransferase
MTKEVTNNKGKGDRRSPLTTSGTFYHGKVVIKQLKKGYRFAVDSPILVDFLPYADAPALEIGCGVGIMALLALHLGKYPSITGVEIQEPLYRLANANAAANGLSGRFHIIHGDFNEIYCRFANVQTIFCNPPFFKTGRGLLSRNETVRLARFEIALTLDNLLRFSSTILAPTGSLCLIFPFSRQGELLDSAAAYGLYPEKIRLLRPFVAAAPDRFLAQLGKSQISCQEESPLVIFKARGVYSPEMERILSGA